MFGDIENLIPKVALKDPLIPVKSDRDLIEKDLNNLSNSLGDLANKLDYLGTRDKLVRDLKDSNSKESRTLNSCTKLMDDCSRLFQLLSRVRFSEHFPYSVLPLMEAKL